MADCLTAVEIEGLLADALLPDEKERAERHLAVCETCRQEIARRRADDELFGKIKQAYEAETVSRRDEPADSRGPPRPPTESIEGYEILNEVHRGGQGVVYKAVQKATKRTVALKVLLEGPYASPRQRHRFEREIDLVASLQHSNIVTVYDSGVTRDGRHFFAMEYIHGQPLDAYLSDKNLGIDETLRLFQTICAAVNHAHQHGVIHRDLKPGNIRVDANGHPHVLDFGLAKAGAGGLTPDGAPVTVTGEFMGTLAYASPEQTKGDPTLIDIRTDVYSLGVILYEMLTGKYPYPVVGQMADVLKNIAEAEPKRPSTIRRQINDEVETVVLKALAKEKERRYQSVENLGRDIEHYLSGQPIDAKRDSALYLIRKSLRRYRVPVAIAAVFVLLLIAFGVTMSIQSERNRRLAERERLAKREALAERDAAQRARQAEEQQHRQLQQQTAREREALLEQCRDAALLMNPDALEEHLERAIHVGMDPSTYHFYRGWAYLLRADLNAAMAEGDKALELNPEYAPAYYLRAGLRAANADWLNAFADFASAQEHNQKTDMDIALSACAKILLGDYDGGLADIDALETRLHGEPIGMWLRGYARFYQHLTDPPADLKERWMLAQAALNNLAPVAKLYARSPGVFDCRADLHFRTALTAKARGEPRVAQEMFRAARAGANHLIEIGATGVGRVYLAQDAFGSGDLELASRLADQAYKDLVQPSELRSSYRSDAMSQSICLRLWCRYSQGDDTAAHSLMKQLERQHPNLSAKFAFGLLHGAGDDEDELARDQSDLGHADYGAFGVGLWVGTTIRGDAKLSAHVANRFSISLRDRIIFPKRTRWRQALLGYLQGNKTARELLLAAGEQAYRVECAKLAIAMRAPSREDRVARLREVLEVASWSEASLCSRSLLFRCERDPTFLANSIEPTTAPSTTKDEE